MTAQLIHGDCIDAMRAMDDACVDSIVTDPPYLISFMGREWDSADGIAGKPDVWREALRVLKPGGHMLAFSGSRTYHRMVCAIEDAGFEIRDQIFWVYGSGFPKSLNVSVAIDKAAGAERAVIGPRVYADGTTGHWAAGGVYASDEHTEALKAACVGKVDTAPATPDAAKWAGWGTALKPAHEPIVVARKPLIGTVAQNVLAHGTGALNIDACRVGTDDSTARTCNGTALGTMNDDAWEARPGVHGGHPAGRWPSNCLHDGSPEVLEAFAAFGEKKTNPGTARSVHKAGMWGVETNEGRVLSKGDTGTAARFFYAAKASKADRAGSKHPTVKPLSLMRYLVKLVTPPAGTVLDMFCGTGTTLLAAQMDGFHAIGIEREAAYVADARKRLGMTFELEAAD